LLPNLEVFLSELREQPQIETIQEDNGSVIIKLKSPVSESSAFITIIEELTERLNLRHYVRASYREIEVVPLQKFLEKMQPYCIGDPQKRETDTLIFLKPGIVTNYPKFREIRLEALKAGAVIITHPHPCLSVPNTLPQGVKVKDSAITAFNIDVASLHADRLRDYYHKNMTKTDAAESIKYLLGCGWTETQLYDLGVSRPTFYRLKKVSAETQG
jgi:hypothetical protein